MKEIKVNSNEIFCEEMLEVNMGKFDEELRKHPYEPIITRGDILKLIAAILGESPEERKRLYKELSDKLKVYLAPESSKFQLCDFGINFGQGVDLSIPHLVNMQLVFYISGPQELLREILRKSRENWEKYKLCESEAVVGMVVPADEKSLKEMKEGNEHEIELYQIKQPFEGNEIVRRVYEYLPPRYDGSKVVSVYNKYGVGGLKIIPQICRVNKAKLPEFKTEKIKTDRSVEKQIRNWVNETIKINEEGIQLEKHIEQDFDQVKDKIYMTLKYLENDKNVHFPYKEFHDFIIVYMIEDVVEGIKFWTEIDADLFYSWNIDVETLHSIACTNTERDYAPMLRTTSDAARQYNVNLLSGDKPFIESKTYVLHNLEEQYGASTIACPGVLAKVAEILDDDFYFYGKNATFLYVSACNENYDGYLLDAPKKLDPMTHEECVCSPYIHKYNRKTKKIETVY